MTEERTKIKMKISLVHVAFWLYMLMAPVTEYSLIFGSFPCYTARVDRCCSRSGWLISHGKSLQDCFLKGLGLWCSCHFREFPKINIWNWAFSLRYRQAGPSSGSALFCPVLSPHLWFHHHRNFHLLYLHCSHIPNTFCVHFFLLHIPHRVCLSYTMCKSVILVSQINAFLALVCLDKGVFLFNAPMNSLKHLQILISGVVQ